MRLGHTMHASLACAFLHLASVWQGQCSAAVASAVPAGWQTKAHARARQGKMQEILPWLSLHVKLRIKLRDTQDNHHETVSQES